MESQDDFEGWLMFMDDAIQQLLDDIPNDVTKHLDFSLDSLIKLEEWLLNKYPSPAAILQPSENWILDRVSRYVGETIRKNAGGEWGIELENPNLVFFRLPVIKRTEGGGYADCPAALVTASLDRRRGNFINTIVRNIEKG